MSSEDLDRFALIDWDRAEDLCYLGAPGYIAAACVTADGETMLWLLSEEHLHEEDAPHGRAYQSHERVGPLPDHVRYRIDNQRCAGLTRRGARCGTLVTGPVGQMCVAHAAEAEAALSGHRCGHRTSTGTPCSRPVREPGRACPYHVKHAATGDRSPDVDAGPGAP